MGLLASRFPCVWCFWYSLFSESFRRRLTIAPAAATASPVAFLDFVARSGEVETVVGYLIELISDTVGVDDIVRDGIERKAGCVGDGEYSILVCVA